MSVSERLGSLTSIRDDQASPRRDEGGGDQNNGQLIQRCVIIQRDEKGYGLTVSGDNPVFVQSVKPDGAASRAGVQQGDRIIKVNGNLVTNSNHIEVVKLIKSGSYVALTVLGKPPGGHSNRDSQITGPQPVNVKQQIDLKQTKIETIQAYYDTTLEEYEKLQKYYDKNPSEKLQAQIQDKYKKVTKLGAELQNLRSELREQNVSPPALTPSRDDESATDSLEPRSRGPKHVKHASVPAFMYRSKDMSEARGSVVSRSKSDAASRQLSYKHPSRDNSFRRGDSESSSMHPTISDLGSMSDSPQTSPNTSPTPMHPVNFDTDSLKQDSGIEESGSISSSAPSQVTIIGMEEEDFESDEEHHLHRHRRMRSDVSEDIRIQTDDHGPFSDLKLLECKPAHMAVFLHYLISNSDPSALFFYIVSNIYSQAKGNAKDMAKWAYEIHSTFLIGPAPLKVAIDENILLTIEQTFTLKAEKEDALRTVFQQAREAAKSEVQELLVDFKQKTDLGLGNIYGVHDLKDNMDRNLEFKTIEKYLYPHLERCLISDEQSSRNDRDQAMGWALATFLRYTGVKSSHSSMERMQSFVMKDKKGIKLPGSKFKSKSIKGHQFVLQHYTKTEFCMQCGGLIWGVGYQGYQCQTCDQSIHKQCIDELEDICTKKKRARDSRSIIPERFRKSQAYPATPTIYPSKDDKDVTGNQGVVSQDGITYPLKEEPADFTTIREGVHSVNKLVDRFNKISNDKSPPPGSSPEAEPQDAKKNADLARSESLKGRADQVKKGDRPARRAKSDVDMDDTTLKALNQSGSSSTSSLSNRSVESPSNSTDNIQTIQEDSDLDCDTELPPLKQILPEEIFRKLKPKQKKLQEVINELFHTEQAHVRNLKILDKLFHRPWLHSDLNISHAHDLAKALFPNIDEMIQLHSSMNNEMKTRRREDTVIKNVGDILLRRFDGDSGQAFMTACAIFCRNQTSALETFRNRQRKDQRLAQWLAETENNPLCRRLQLKDHIVTQMQRLTKYPLLIENLLKYTLTSCEDYSRLERCLQCSKNILEYVNQAVKDCENHQRLVDLQRKIDKKQIDNSRELEPLRTLDLSKHKLVYDAPLTWKMNPKRQIELHVVLLEDYLVLLQKSDDKLLLKLQSTMLVSGNQDSKHTHNPLLRLSNVLIKNVATDKKAFFVVSTSSSGPQIYELVASTSDGQKKWCSYINQASELLKNREVKPSLPSTEVQIQQPETIISVRDSIVAPHKLSNDSQRSDHERDVLQVSEPPEIQPQPIIVSDELPQLDDSYMSPLEKLRKNDAEIQESLRKRERLVAEILDIPVSKVQEQAQTAGEVDLDTETEARELILACIHQSNQMIGLIGSSSELLLNTQHADMTKEELANLTLPIPMDRLREMAGRMNQILTNLLASARAPPGGEPGPDSEAVVNSRDEERERLRQELKAAQGQLNMLREIQRAASPVYSLQGRPTSMVSVTSSEPGDESTEPQSEKDEEKDEGGNIEEIAVPELMDTKEEMAETEAPELEEEKVESPSEPDMITQELDSVEEAGDMGEQELVPDTREETGEPESSEVIEGLANDSLREIEPPEEECLEDVTPDPLEVVFDSEPEESEVNEAEVHQVTDMATEEVMEVQEEVVTEVAPEEVVQVEGSEEDSEDSMDKFEDAAEPLEHAAVEDDMSGNTGTAAQSETETVDLGPTPSETDCDVVSEVVHNRDSESDVQTTDLDESEMVVDGEEVPQAGDCEMTTEEPAHSDCGVQDGVKTETKVDSDEGCGSEETLGKGQKPEGDSDSRQDSEPDCTVKGEEGTTAPVEI